MIKLADSIIEGDSFLEPGEARERLAALATEAGQDGDDSGHVRIEYIGESEEGRRIEGHIVGHGPIRVSLIAGAHADEPVGPDTLRRFLLVVAQGGGRELLGRYTFYVIPHVNPDGENRNWPWISLWPDLHEYVKNVIRELPGRDVEFGYPDRRVENQAVSTWMGKYGPFNLHMSLHSMGFSDGAMLLIEKNWSYRTEELQAGFSLEATRLGLSLHDHNRKGEKGFFQIAPGFTTTPEGHAMRTYFLSHGDSETANLFSDSSMEFVRSLGGDPLCLVTELPLFLVKGMTTKGRADSYVRFRREYLPIMRERLAAGKDVSEIEREFGLVPLPLATARRLQLTALDLGLATISG